MMETSIKVEELKEALKLIKGVNRVSRELLQSIKELEGESTPYKVGQKVECWWAGWDRTGVVVDPLVNYNHALEFMAKHCEPACIIRFEGEEAKAPDDRHLSIHEVVPHRQIKKVV